jgi:hypothetical protein
VVAAIKQGVSANLFDKLFLFGQNTDHWKNELAKQIAPDQLPARLGGTNRNFN